MSHYSETLCCTWHHWSHSRREIPGKKTPQWNISNKMNLCHWCFGGEATLSRSREVLLVQPGHKEGLSDMQPITRNINRLWENTCKSTMVWRFLSFSHFFLSYEFPNAWIYKTMPLLCLGVNIKRIATCSISSCRYFLVQSLFQSWKQPLTKLSSNSYLVAVLVLSVILPVLHQQGKIQATWKGPIIYFWFGSIIL